DSLPVFLHHIARALASELDGAAPPRSDDGEPGLPLKSAIAQEHGQQRLKLGFDASSLVREYFALRSCVFDLATSAGVATSPAEEEVLTRCIATGIGDAIRAYTDNRDEMMQLQASKHLGFLAHELRNCLGAAQLATMSMEKMEGTRESRPFQVLQRNLDRMRELIDRALVDARLTARAELFLEPVDL